MSGNDENIELLKRAWAAYDSGDEEGFADCLTPDWQEHGGGSVATLEDEREAMRLHRTAFPDKRTEMHVVLADKSTVACWCTTTATHTGRYFDLAPTDRTVVMHEMMFNRIRDGRLCETWAMVDGPGFHEQLTGEQSPPQPDNMV